MYNNYDFDNTRCSRCGCNQSWGFSDFDDFRCNDNTALLEAEFVARNALRRRQRENRCAREFVRCMRNARCNSRSNY